MRPEVEGIDKPGAEARLPLGVALKPPVSVESLTSGVEHDPEGAEEFVSLIRSLRSEGARPVTL